MERARRAAARLPAAAPPAAKPGRKPGGKADSASQAKSRPAKAEDQSEDARPESPFFGFTNSDIPQPIIIKTESIEGTEDEEECTIVRVTKASVPLPALVIKKEKEDENDLEVFHGFSLDDLPKPIVIKEEPVEGVCAERSGELQLPASVAAEAETNCTVPGDDLLDEFVESTAGGQEDGAEDRPALATLPVAPLKKILTSPRSPRRPVAAPASPVKAGQAAQAARQSPQQQQQQAASPGKILLSPKRDSPKFVVVPGKRPAQPKMDTKAGPNTAVSSSSQQQKTFQQPTPIETEPDDQQALPKNIQIIDQNGDKIEFITSDPAEVEDTDTEEEDREFTVIVEEDEEGVSQVSRDYHIDENNVIEADSIEDIIAQFESESSTPRSVSCPNCRKCFVSSHFLNIHISNSATMCDLCNTQCCSQVNLRNHKNLECDLSKRKRNIDLIAQETAILGRKPIEPEKYYNVPVESEEEEEGEEEDDELGSPPPALKKLKSINDAKYECALCGRYVKILDSHMRFVHGMESGARGSKFRCPECSVLVSDLESHVERRHGENAEKIVVEDEEMVGEIVRCRHPGCDLFFNNGEEVAEHIKQEHTDDVKLACGMGGCDEVFDNRGALKRHRTDAHPELDEFKPVDLEPDDPDRQLDMTVACPVCERKFKHKNTCTVHIKTNHLGWTKRKLFECPECLRAFDNKRAVDAHREAVHLGIRTVCPLCDKPVTRLDLHVRMVHTELPEWPCPDCGKKFKRKFDLNRHRVTVHLGVRNFPCDLCGKRFADMKDMTRHKNAVHYGMKIKWNSRKHKEKMGKLRGRQSKREDGEVGGHYRRKERRAEVKLEDGSLTTVEYIETSGEEIIATDDMITRGDLEGSTVILDPVLQSQLAAVQGGPGEPRVLIEADPDTSGGLRFVVIQEEEPGPGLQTETVES